MNRNTNWSICRIICWGLSVVAGLALMVGLSAVVGKFLGIIAGFLFILFVGQLFQRLVCIEEPEDSATMLEMSQAAIERAKDATGVTTRKELASREQAASVPAAAKPAPPKEDPKPAPAPAASAASDVEDDGVREGAGEGRKPQVLSAPKDGQADDLKQIKGVGPKLEQMLNGMGFYHFTQIASWTSEEVAWVDVNLTGFKGRVSRDNWVEQAKILAVGGETEFSKRVEDGDVY